jgi:hypothetical protein
MTIGMWIWYIKTSTTEQVLSVLPRLAPSNGDTVIDFLTLGTRVRAEDH